MCSLKNVFRYFFVPNGRVYSRIEVTMLITTLGRLTFTCCHTAMCHILGYVFEILRWIYGCLFEEPAGLLDTNSNIMTDSWALYSKTTLVHSFFTRIVIHFNGYILESSARIMGIRDGNAA